LQEATIKEATNQRTPEIAAMIMTKTTKKMVLEVTMIRVVVVVMRVDGVEDVDGWEGVEG
jgi:hypothetical protein